MLQACVLEFP
jgi:hypothetical protein